MYSQSTFLMKSTPFVFNVSECTDISQSAFRWRSAFFRMWLGVRIVANLHILCRSSSSYRCHRVNDYLPICTFWQGCPLEKSLTQILFNKCRRRICVSLENAVWHPNLWDTLLTNDMLTFKCQEQRDHWNWILWFHNKVVSLGIASPRLSQR